MPSVWVWTAFCFRCKLLILVPLVIAIRTGPNLSNVVHNFLFPGPEMDIEL